MPKLLLVLLVNLLWWNSSVSFGNTVSTPTTKAVQPAVHRLSMAVARASALAAAFDALRDAIGQGETHAEIIQALGEDERVMLNGSSAICKALGSRFESAQGKVINLDGNLSRLDEGLASTLAEEMEGLSEDLNAHFLRVRELAVSQLSSGSSARSTIAAVQVVPNLFVGSPLSHAPSTGRVTDDIEKLTLTAKQLSDRGDPSILAEVKRLSARASRLTRAEDWQQLELSIKELHERAENALNTDSRREVSPGTRGSTRGPQTATFNWRPGDACTEQAVLAAGGQFDATLAKFRKVKKIMLPPELENLHRVVHTLEAMKNGILAEFAQALQPSSCEQYFAGVGQLEVDLAHYRGMLTKQKKARKGGNKNQRQAGLNLPALSVDGGTASQLPPAKKSRPALSSFRF